MKLRRLLFWTSIPVAVFAIFLGGYLYLTVDEPPPADADLMPVREAVPDEENGYFALALDRDEIALPPEKLMEIHDREFNADWDPQPARKVLSDNQDVLERFEKSLGAPRFMLPELDSFNDPRFREVMTFRLITDVVIIRLLTSFHEGREDEAFRDAMKVVRFGDRLSGQGACIIHLLIGDSIRDTGIYYLKRMTPRTTLAAPALAGFVKELSRRADPEDRLIQTLKGEYRLQVKVIEGIARGGQDPAELTPLGKWSRFLPEKVFFNPNRTRRALGGAYRELIGKVRSNAVPEEPDDGYLFLPVASASSWIPSKNLLGKQIFLDPKLRDRILRLHLHGKASLAMIQAFISLKACRTAKGSLPATLDDLVPEFLEGVPLDPYDGRPLRYSPERKVLYSVGEDRKDAGGSLGAVETSGLDWNEPTFRIEFE